MLARLVLSVSVPCVPKELLVIVELGKVQKIGGLLLVDFNNMVKKESVYASCIPPEEIVAEARYSKWRPVKLKLA